MCSKIFTEVNSWCSWREPFKLHKVAGMIKGDAKTPIDARVGDVGFKVFPWNVDKTSVIRGDLNTAF